MVFGPIGLNPRKYFESRRIADELLRAQQNDPDSTENTRLITNAVMAHLPVTQHGNVSRIVSSVQGLLRGMNPNQQADFIKALQVSPQSTNAATIIDNAAEIQRLSHEEFTRKAALETKRLAELEASTLDKREQAIRKARGANWSSSELLAAAAFLLGGTDKISAAISEANRRRRRDHMTSDAAMAAAFDAGFTGAKSGNMQHGVVQDGYTGSDASQVSAAYGRANTGRDPFAAAYDREIRRLERQQVQQELNDWQQNNPENRTPANATPILPAADRAVVDKTLADNPGATFDRRTNIMTLPGGGRYRIENGRSVQIETPQQSAERLQGLEERRQRARELGATLAEDGRTFVFPDGRKVVQDDQNRISRVTLTPRAAAQSRVEISQQTGQSLLEKERQRAAEIAALPNVSRSPIRGTILERLLPAAPPVPATPIPPAAPQLHIGRVDITPDIAGVIRTETQSRQRRIIRQNDLQDEQRDLAVAAPRLPNGAPSVVAPAPVITPEQRRTASWSAWGTSWFGRTVTTDRMDTYTRTDTSNRIIAADVKKEDEQSWLLAKAGALRRGWNAYQDRMDGFWSRLGWQKSEQQLAQERHVTSRWAYDLVQRWSGTQTAEQIAEAARLKLEADKALAASPTSNVPTAPTAEPPKPESPGLIARIGNYFSPTQTPAAAAPATAPVVAATTEPPSMWSRVKGLFGASTPPATPPAAPDAQVAAPPPAPPVTTERGNNPTVAVTAPPATEQPGWFRRQINSVVNYVRGTTPADAQVAASPPPVAPPPSPPAVEPPPVAPPPPPVVAQTDAEKAAAAAAAEKAAAEALLAERARGVTPTVAGVTPSAPPVTAGFTPIPRRDTNNMTPLRSRNFDALRAQLPGTAREAELSQRRLAERAPPTAATILSASSAVLRGQPEVAVEQTREPTKDKTEPAAVATVDKPKTEPAAATVAAATPPAAAPPAAAPPAAPPAAKPDEKKEVAAATPPPKAAPAVPKIA